MQDVINDLLGAEDEGQKLIQAAEEESRTLRSRLENDYSQKLNDAKDEARKTIQREVEGARAALQAEDARIIAAANERGDSLWKEKQKLINDVTDSIVAFLVTPEYEKE